jgi:hypothetical protein
VSRFAAPLAVLPLESVTVSIKNCHCLKTQHTLIINRRTDGIVGIILGYGLNVGLIVVRFRTEARDLIAISIFVWVGETVLLRAKRPGHEADCQCSLQDVRVCERTGYEISTYRKL